MYSSERTAIILGGVQLGVIVLQQINIIATIIIRAGCTYNPSLIVGYMASNTSLVVTNTTARLNMTPNSTFGSIAGSVQASYCLSYNVTNY